MTASGLRLECASLAGAGVGRSIEQILLNAKMDTLPVAEIQEFALCGHF